VRDKKPIPKESEEEEGFLIEFPPLPRVSFWSANEQEVIQLQGDSFTYNWRHGNQGNYPHFENVYKNFLEEWSHFNKWLLEDSGIESIKFSGYQLTYLNFIKDSSGWSTTLDHSKVFTFFGSEYNAGLGDPLFHDARLAFLLPNDMGILDIEVDQGSSGEEENKFDFALFKLTAKTSNTDISLQEWFEFAHKQVIQAFLRLTTKEAQKRWGLL
jgi:uncharacterized protein (TIGR04255 family)